MLFVLLGGRAEGGLKLGLVMVQKIIKYGSMSTAAFGLLITCYGHSYIFQRHLIYRSIHNFGLNKIQWYINCFMDVFGVVNF